MSEDPNTGPFFIKDGTFIPLQQADLSNQTPLQQVRLRSNRKIFWTGVGIVALGFVLLLGFANWVGFLAIPAGIIVMFCA